MTGHLVPSSTGHEHAAVMKKTVKPIRESNNNSAENDSIYPTTYCGHVCNYSGMLGMMFGVSNYLPR